MVIGCRWTAVDPVLHSLVRVSVSHGFCRPAGRACQELSTERRKGRKEVRERDALGLERGLC